MIPKKIIEILLLLIFSMTVAIEGYGQKREQNIKNNTSQMLMELNEKIETLSGKIDRLKTKMDARFDGLTTGLKWYGGILASIIVALLGFLLNGVLKLASGIGVEKEEKKSPPS